MRVPCFPAARFTSSNRASFIGRADVSLEANTEKRSCFPLRKFACHWLSQGLSGCRITILAVYARSCPMENCLTGVASLSSRQPLKARHRENWSQSPAADTELERPMATTDVLIGCDYVMRHNVPVRAFALPDARTRFSLRIHPVRVDVGLD